MKNIFLYNNTLYLTTLVRPNTRHPYPFRLGQPDSLSRLLFLDITNICFGSSKEGWGMYLVRLSQFCQLEGNVPELADSYNFVHDTNNFTPTDIPQEFDDEYYSYLDEHYYVFDDDYSITHM